MHHGTGENSFASTMTQINESTSWNVVRIMPTLRILVFLSLLDPLEYLEEWFELDLAVGQVDFVEAASVPLFPTFNLQNNKEKHYGPLKFINDTYFSLVTCEILSYNVEKLRPSLDIGFIFLGKMFIEHLLSILLLDIIHISDAKSLTEKLLRIDGLPWWLHGVRAVDEKPTGSSSAIQIDELFWAHGLPIDRFTDNRWW